MIPYFGYKYHRRGLPISTAYQSRFLWSAALDFAKMLQAVGVDSVVSVDLQRPGQGHEVRHTHTHRCGAVCAASKNIQASLFDSSVPAETWSSNDALIDYVVANLDLGNRLVVVSANRSALPLTTSAKLTDLYA